MDNPSPRCPMCGSAKVVREEWWARNDPLRASSATRSLTNRFRCEVCGESWIAEEVPNRPDFQLLLRLGRIAALMVSGLLLIDLQSPVRVLVALVLGTAGLLDLLALAISKVCESPTRQDAEKYA